MSANLKFHFVVNSTQGQVYICEGLTPVKWDFPWLRPWEICQGFHVPVKILGK
ncbi:hypothetical protein MTR_1g098615 [Medicago truncatula]|uniref:Uncharacterized protein n=1 Tax=Medicago truncatula TaxID=3880 RepID=A0A072VNQ4_MEDTR|nr:hypothetical protein MTR_1g098615 [Medicago truncatula]